MHVKGERMDSKTRAKGFLLNNGSVMIKCLPTSFNALPGTR